MPSKTLKAYAKQYAEKNHCSEEKALDKAEEAWDSCRDQAKGKFKEEDGHYWTYVNVCCRMKLGIEHKEKKAKGKK